jgi:hypothetical protein
MGNTPAGEYTAVPTTPVADAPGSAAPGLIGSVARLFGANPILGQGAGKKIALTPAEKIDFEARIGDMLLAIHVRERELTEKTKRYKQLGQAQRAEGHKDLAYATARIVKKCVDMRTVIMQRIGQLEDLNMRIVLNDLTLESAKIMHSITADVRQKLTEQGGSEAMEQALDDFRDVMESLNGQVERIDEVIDVSDPTGGIPLPNSDLDALLDDLPPPLAATTERRPARELGSKVPATPKKVALLSQ